MSKAIQGVAMLGGAALIGAGMLFPGTAAFFNNPLFYKAMEALVVGGISMEAGAIAASLSANRGNNVTIRQPASFRQFIYGEQRVGGVLIFQSTTGSHHDQVNQVIVLAGHVCDSIVNIYLDGRQVYFTGSGVGNSTRNGVNFGGNADSNSHTGPNGVQYNFGGLVYVEARYGDQLPGDVMGSLRANDPTWAADSAGNSPWVGGCTYIYFKREYDTNMFPNGDPEVRVTVRGKQVFDPRTGTTAYSTNWALIVNDVLTDPQFGLGLDYGTWINNAQLVAAANVCDEAVALAAGGTEARYSCHFHNDSSMGPGNVLANLMPGAAGRLSFIGGEYYIWPAYWQGPSFTFDLSAVTSEEIEWNPNREPDQLFNRVNGTYVAPNYPYNVAGNLYDSNLFYDGQQQDNFPFAFQPTSFPQFACDTLHGYSTDQFLAEDGGLLLPHDVTFQCVLSVAQVQRLAKIMLLRNRFQGTGSWEMGLQAFAMQETDVMQFTCQPLGWTEKLLEAQAPVFRFVPGEGGNAPEVRIAHTFAETDASIYEWSVTEEKNPYNVAAVPNQAPYTPAPPTNLTLTSGAGTALITLDGVVHPRIEVQWNAPQDALTRQIQVRYALVSAPTVWIDNGPVDASLTVAYIAGVVAGQAYNVQIRGVRANGGASVWVEIDGYTVSKTLSTVGLVAIAQGALTGEAFTDGTAGIVVASFTAVIGNASVAVLPGGPYTLTGLTQQQLWYVYYVDPGFAGGAVTPIATQNTADFLNRPGYFLIGSVVTPYAGLAAARFMPSNFVDQGTRATASPDAAYDGNLSTAAIVSGSYFYRAGGGFGGGAPQAVTTQGVGVWAGFPSRTLSAAATATVVAAYAQQLGMTASIDAQVAAGTVTDFNLLSASASSGTATYTATLPSGTNLANLSIVAQVNGSTGSGTSASTFVSQLSVYEIYIQT